jgi:two-component system, OmpR family, alkaline phosphatase synthesis response regulator PhoP
VPHILIVDDERDVAALLQFLLEKEGYRVTTAFNGAEALSQLGVEPEDAEAGLPDVALIDVMMPLVDGYTVCAKLARSPRAGKVPVIMLTGKNEMRETFEKLPNVAAYLVKPFDPKKLRDAIAAALAKASQEPRRG